VEIEMTKTRKTYLGLVFLMVALPAGAADLGSDQVRNLANGAMWSTKNMLNSNQLRSFDWKKDGTLCLRLGGTDGKCDDQGTWKVEGQRMCYELTWWMKSQGMTSACFGVSDLGNGSYEATLPSGTRFMQFTVAR
jgi:hypothetical protein